MATRLYAIADTYAMSDEDSPHGSSSHMAAITDAYHTAYSYVEFNLSGWVGKQLDEDNGAILYLYISSKELVSSTRIRFRRITEGWYESTLKWSNRPDVEGLKSKYIDPSADRWVTYNITDLIQDILDEGEGCCGVRIEVQSGVLWFSSREGSYTPKLYLIEAVSQGAIVSGFIHPASQDPGEIVKVISDIKNIGVAGGYFVVSYYEGSTFLSEFPRVWVNPGQKVTYLSDPFTMPDHDYHITIKITNSATGKVDDTLTVICFLLTSGEYYVQIEGNDEYPGTSWAAAWKTIDKAARSVPDGSTVHIGFGAYNAEPAGNMIAPQNVGAEGIRYLPETAGSEGGTGTVRIEKNA